MYITSQNAAIALQAKEDEFEGLDLGQHGEALQ